MSKELPKNIYEEMSKNRWRTLFLFTIFPLLIIGLTFLGIIIAGGFSGVSIDESINAFYTIIPWILGGTILWSIISYLSGSRMILGYAGAKKAGITEHPELFNIVDNLSITAGLPKPPEIYIVNDESMNAFATGTSPSNAKVAVTTGLLNALNKQELEGVLAHEIGHVINRDIRVMLIVIAVLGAIQLIGEILVRSRVRSRDSKGGNLLPLIGILFLTIGVIIGLLTKMAISREREYLADATGGHLCGNPLALASALGKISTDSRVEILDGKPSVGAICIEDPTAKTAGFWQKIWSTHPPTTERIRRLQSY